MRSLSLPIALACALCACATVPQKQTPLEQAGDEMGRGFLSAMDREAPKTMDALVKALAEDIRQDVLTEETNRKLAQTVQAVGGAAREQLPGMRDELVGKETERRLQQMMLVLMAALDARARQTTHGLMAEAGEGLHRDVMSRENEARLNEILAGLGGTARDQTKLFRDDMLSPQTQEQTRLIVATAMDEVVLATERIREKAHNELSFAERNAAVSITVAGILGAALAFTMWRQKEKNRILLNLLMAQVRNTSGEKGEEIFRVLEQQAQHLGVSSVLKNTLAKLGIVTLEKDGKAKGSRAA